MRQIIVERAPTLERGIAAVEGWWAGLSLRERWLIGVLGTILLALGLVYGVVKPLQAARAQTLATIKQYETLNARILAAGTLNSSPQAIPAGAPQMLVQQAAQRNGVTATVTPTDAGASAVVADASYDAVIAWIGDVQRTSALGVVRADIRRLSQQGHVSARLEFGR